MMGIINWKICCIQLDCIQDCTLSLCLSSNSLLELSWWSGLLHSASVQQSEHSYAILVDGTLSICFSATVWTLLISMFIFVASRHFELVTYWFCLLFLFAAD